MKNESRGYPLNQSPLYKLVRRAKLATLLGLTDAELRYLSKHSCELYREKDIPKKNGDGMRHIEDPEHRLKKVQSTLAAVLGRISPPDHLFCPVKGRCYVSNAAQHRGNRVVRCLDVRKYFPNTPSKRVFWFFHKVMKCDRAIAAILARLACYNGHLPTGSPLSPIMAYYAYYDVWSNVAAICKAYGYTLTVYIDDVTVSGRAVSAKVMWEIKKAIHRSGLRYHKEKTYIDTPAEITGVIVDGVRLTPPNRQFQKIRNTEIALKTMVTADASGRLHNQLTGLKGQLRQICTKSLVS